MFFRGVLSLVLMFLSIPTLAGVTCPAGMRGSVKVAVQYVPAEHWDRFPDFVGAHLKFLANQMAAGHIQSAGPFLLPDGNIDGGLAIYNSSDEKQVAQWASGDKLVSERVATLSFRSWLECSLAQ